MRVAEVVTAGTHRCTGPANPRAHSPGQGFRSFALPGLLRDPGQARRGISCLKPADRVPAGPVETVAAADVAAGAGLDEGAVGLVLGVADAHSTCWMRAKKLLTSPQGAGHVAVAAETDATGIQSRSAEPAPTTVNRGDLPVARFREAQPGRVRAVGLVRDLRDPKGAREAAGGHAVLCRLSARAARRPT
jgi:hypothetical protein